MVKLKKNKTKTKTKQKTKQNKTKTKQKQNKTKQKQQQKKKIYGMLINLIIKIPHINTFCLNLFFILKSHMLLKYVVICC